MSVNHNKNTLTPSSPFMSEYDPQNPYGLNYIEHSYDTKLFYKVFI